MDTEALYWKLCETVTPIFDKDRGQRLKHMRQALLLDQKQLAHKLGTHQQMIAKLELGQIKVGRTPIRLLDLYKVFGAATHHILFGADAEKYNYVEINQRYWKQKDKGKGDRTTVRLTRKQRLRSYSRRRDLSR
jgi:transcriptional regulator with XRE-family HTH domain